MFREEYIKEMNSFALSENFKSDTIALLKARQQDIEGEKTVLFTPKKKSRLPLAVCAVVVLCAGLYLYSTTTTPDVKTFYTIEDVQPVDEIAAENPLKAVYNNGGGMGFEALMLKDIEEYDNGSPFAVTDSFKTLPVFHFNTPDLNQIEKEAEELLGNLDVNTSGNKAQITFTELIYQEGHLASHKDTTVDSSNDICERVADDLLFIPHRYETSFTEGDLQMWIPRGEIRLTVNTAKLTDGTEDEKTQLTEFITEAYPRVLGYSNAAVYTETDYNIYGEENNLYHLYNKGKDYGENLFNYSVNNTRIYYTPMAESGEETDSLTLWSRSDCYTRGEDMPAINWQQALGLLYAGEYFSSVPYQITDDSKVNRIELVYKEGPYDQSTLLQSELCLPFYKFYVKLDENPIGAKDESLETYGIYYVCAINPNCIEITDNYAQFN